MNDSFREFSRDMTLIGKAESVLAGPLDEC